MNTDTQQRGICSVVQCSICPMKVSDLCPGCRERDINLRRNGNRRCAIIVCALNRGLESCFHCDSFPCNTFTSPESLYLPAAREELTPSQCNVTSIAHDPKEVSRTFIRRLARYLMVAEHGRHAGKEIGTSAEFASALGIKPELVRKDFASLGKLRKNLTSLGNLGIPHVGYNLELCVELLRKTLNLHSIRNIVWIGLQKPYSPRRLIERLAYLGCRIVAILDEFSEKARKIDSLGTVRIFDFGDLDRVIKNLAVVGSVIACEDDRAQHAVDRLIELGIKSYLNLTPVPLDHPEDVFIRNIDVSEDIMLFSFYCGEE